MLVLIAVVAAATSLCARFWPGSQRPTGPRPAGNPATDSAPGRDFGRTLPPVELVDEKGDAVSLRGLLPAVIILVDGCDCAGGVDATARVNLRRYENYADKQPGLAQAGDHHDEETTLVIGALTFAGAGWHTTGDALLANTSADLARHRRVTGREELAHEHSFTIAAGAVPAAA